MGGIEGMLGCTEAESTAAVVGEEITCTFVEEVVIGRVPLNDRPKVKCILRVGRHRAR